MKKEFQGTLLLEYIDGRNWRLRSAFTWVGTVGGKTVRVSVPAGFVTDFASVPRFFWRILPPTGSYGKAAVIHDWLYRTGLLPKAECDLVFLTAMTELGVARWKRVVMYRAVSWFGGSSYKGTR